MESLLCVLVEVKTNFERLGGLYGTIYTLSGRIGKVVASHAAVTSSIPAEAALIYIMHEALRGNCPWGWGVRSVNWIYRLWRHIRSWLWSNTTRSSPLGCFSRLLQVVDYWPHILN